MEYGTKNVLVTGLRTGGGACARVFLSQSFCHHHHHEAPQVSGSLTWEATFWSLGWSDITLFCKMGKFIFDRVKGKKHFCLTFSSFLAYKKPKEDIRPWRRIKQFLFTKFVLPQSTFSEALCQVKKQH